MTERFILFAVSLGVLLIAVPNSARSQSDQYVLRLGTFSRITIEKPTFVPAGKPIAKVIKESQFLGSYFQHIRARPFGAGPNETIEDAITRIQRCIGESLADSHGRAIPLEAYAAICTNFNRATGKLAAKGVRWNGGVIVRATTPTELVMDEGRWLRQIHRGISDAMEFKAVPSSSVASVGLKHLKCFGPPPTRQQDLVDHQAKCGELVKDCAVPYLDENANLASKPFNCSQICPKGKFVYFPGLVARLLDNPPGTTSHVPDMLEGLKRGYARGGARFPSDFRLHKKTPEETIKSLSNECLGCPSEMKVVNGECLDKFGCSFPFETYDNILGQCDSELENKCKTGTTDSMGRLHCKEHCENRCLKTQSDLKHKISRIKKVMATLSSVPGGGDVEASQYPSDFLSDNISGDEIVRTASFRRNPNAIRASLRQILLKMESDLIDTDASVCKRDIIHGCKYNSKWIDDEYIRLFGELCFFTGDCDSTKSCPKCTSAMTEMVTSFNELIRTQRRIGNCYPSQIYPYLHLMNNVILNDLWKLSGSCDKQPQNNDICSRATFPSDNQILQYLENRGINCRPNSVNKSTNPTPNQNVEEDGT